MRISDWSSDVCSSDLHPIFARWPAQYPDRLQLFSLPTPNGVKVGIMLEETSLAYEPHRIDIMAAANHDPAFLAPNPNGKIGRASGRARVGPHGEILGDAGALKNKHILTKTKKK